MSLETLRKEIDAIDDQMQELFKRRMEVSKKIGHYKKLNHLPITDEKRELELLKMRREKLNNDFLWHYYQPFIVKVMELSKAYQHE